jgi:carbamoyl-phosphate synthase large subunit
MNPRVSRSSALASKATGFPIAKIAAKLAIGYTLDELPNDITRETPACFEPSIDYVVVKIPRWAFEKFPGADPTLMTQMKSVGEVMAIGRTFNEALQKALRGLEIGRYGLGADGKGMHYDRMGRDQLRQVLKVPHPDRLFQIRSAFRAGFSAEELYDITGIDPWFLRHIQEIVQAQDELALYNPKRRGTQGPDAALETLGESTDAGLSAVEPDVLRAAKRMGFSDRQIAVLVGSTENAVRQRRKSLGIVPTVKLVDTCAAEFEARTPYYYISYEEENEFRPSRAENVIILGAGPNRIGQGIEFDYCCVHAAFALRESGREAIMINSNPETVSTDYDTSDKLYFEPLTLEDVLNITDLENPTGVIVQFGGQTPLNLARELERHGVPILGTPPEMIERAENREFFAAMLRRIGARQPPNGTATSKEQAVVVANRIGYPVLVRPSFVLGGRAMAIVYNDDMLRAYMEEAVEASPDAPVLIDKFLEEAIEIDVDAISDGQTCVVGGIMEHIEEAGIHSGDSACVLPPFSLGPDEIEEIMRQTKALAQELQVRGLMNVQYAIKGEQLYVLEVNPRASRTIPFVSKAIGVPLAKLATHIMLGATLDELGFTTEVETEHTAVKYPVFPFDKFSGIDYLLGPEMKSTGEVMGIDRDFGAAFAKAYIAAHCDLPLRGTIFLSVRNQDKRDCIFLGKQFRNLGFHIVATEGTARALRRAGIEAEMIHRVSEAGSPNAIDLIRRDRIQMIVNTPSGAEPRADMQRIRREAILYDVPLITTVAGAMVATLAIEALQRGELDVRSLQEYHQRVRDAFKS